MTVGRVLNGLYWCCFVFIFLYLFFLFLFPVFVFFCFVVFLYCYPLSLWFPSSSIYCLK